ncbi:type II toxin-antitoxin system VapC family toxin [Gracilimonas halophila]|uniref:Type II toxin-antitoxin system VapC family toxin n=1 Tax=Gracilimonas halophila TaxID=1834464 RepID=A0ABW5JGB9_9BACT
MSGNNIVADTSLLVNFFNGVEPAGKILQGQHIWVSAITEIELLSYSGLTKKQSTIIRSFLDECTITELSPSIRKIAIEVRKKDKLKLPDAVIAATSIYLDFPLITMDNDFEKVKDLNAIVLETEV